MPEVTPVGAKQACAVVRDGFLCRGPQVRPAFARAARDRAPRARAWREPCLEAGLGERLAPLVERRVGLVAPRARDHVLRQGVEYRGLAQRDVGPEHRARAEIQRRACDLRDVVAVDRCLALVRDGVGRSAGSDVRGLIAADIEKWRAQHRGLLLDEVGGEVE